MKGIVSAESTPGLSTPAKAASGKRERPLPNYQRNLMLLTTVPTMTIL